MSITKRTGTLYPRWSSCSFLGINYYEQISSQFEEYLSEALIPENSCLLNEVCYPLENIDTFYRSPWAKAEYDEEFLEKEANKVDEHINAICVNNFLFDEKNFVHDIEPEANSSESINFEEENLHIVREKISDYKDFQCLEVPFIPNSVLKLKVNDTYFQNMLKNLTLMELNDITVKESTVSLKDLEECMNIPLTPENDDGLLPKAYEDFKELILPEIASDTEFGKFSSTLKHRTINLSENNKESNVKKNYPFKKTFTENLDCKASSSSYIFKNKNINSSQSILEPNLKDDYSPLEREFKVNLDNASKIHFTSEINNFSEQDFEDSNSYDVTCFKDDKFIGSPLFHSINEGDTQTESLPLCTNSEGDTQTESLPLCTNSETMISEPKALISAFQSLPSDANTELVILEPKAVTFPSQSQLGCNNTEENQLGLTKSNIETYTSCITMQNHKGSAINYTELIDNYCEPHRVMTLQDNTRLVHDHLVPADNSTKIKEASACITKSDCGSGSLYIKNKVLGENCNSETLEDDFMHIDENLFPVKYSDSNADDFQKNCNQVSDQTYCTGTLEDDFKNTEKYSYTYFDDFDENIAKRNTYVENANICHKSETNLQNNHSPKSKNKSTFFEKLSDLQINRSAETLVSLDYKDEKNEANLCNGMKRSVHRDDTSAIHKSTNCQNGNKIKVREQSLGKTQISEHVELLNFWLLIQKREHAGRDNLNSSPTFYENQEFSSDSLKSGDFHMKQVFGSNTLSPKEISSPAFEKKERLQQFSAKDIVITLPEDYLELAIMHETVAIPLVQKLACWEGFQFSLDLTLLDISLDTMRFLLNQEMKSCKDRNLSPLKGGVKYSNYVQLLILHGILKSLNSLAHFGAELSLSTLLDFTKKHSGFPKDCFEDLITKVTDFVQKLPTAKSVHPKIEGLSAYLEQKYYFCKENLVPFKVLIILKQHLNFFFSTFEASVKTRLPEIAVELIIESSVLQQDSSSSRDDKDHIYVAWSSSLSNDVSWINLTLVIEYETDISTCWKSICVEHNVAYACIKLTNLQFKTLNEIKNFPVSKDYSSKNIEKKRKVFFVADASVCSEYNLKSIVDDMQDVVLYERSYKMHLPHLHFADIVVNARSGLVIAELISFFNNDFLKQFVERISNLHRKFDVCWIIIQDDLSSMKLDKAYLNKIKSSFYTFYMSMKTENNRSFKLKFLYAKTSDEVSKWINQVLSKSYKSFSYDFSSYPDHPLSVNVKQEELFLLSFPSLNPINVSIILSSGCSLLDVMSFKLDELYSQYPYIPERFLRNFHSLVHQKVYSSQNPSEAIQDEILDAFPNRFVPCSPKDTLFDAIPYSGSDIHTNSFKEFPFRKDANKSIKSRCVFENCGTVRENSNFNIAYTNKETQPRCNFEELDNEIENYDTSRIHTDNATKIGHHFKNPGFEAENYDINIVQPNSIAKSKCNFKVLTTGSKRYNTNIVLADKVKESSHNFDIHSLINKSWSPDDFSQMSLEDIDKSYRELQLESNVYSSNDTNNSESMHSSSFDSISTESQFTLNFPNARMDEDEMDVDLIISENRPDSPVKNIQHYVLNKQPPLPGSNKIKRKVTFSCDDDYSSPQQKKGKSSKVLNFSQFAYKKKKCLNNDSKQSKLIKCSQDSILNKSFRVQKGQSSKTVCKQTLFKKAQSQEFLPRQKSVYSSRSAMSQSSIPQFELKSFKTIHFDDMQNEYPEKMDLPCMSQENMVLTPNQCHKLSYEKIPGSKGQTRIVFH